jgi:dihydromethanopterin reductase
VWLPDETSMPDVRSMCAIGLSGQLGLNGQLPWEGDPRPAFVADVKRFFEMTDGHVLIAGPRTIAAVPEFAYKTRTIMAIRSSMKPEDVLAQFPDRVVFVGGGPPVWDVYAPYIRHWDITRLPYDGPADRWFNPKWLATTAKRPNAT